MCLGFACSTVVLQHGRELYRGTLVAVELQLGTCLFRFLWTTRQSCSVGRFMLRFCCEVEEEGFQFAFRR